ncbi:MAG TPA: hypothetical protein VLV16_12725 [Gemmatimonadales bacterium]|nr:hypothetical protein [Gemmatimonadales bacterium]
MTPRGRFFLTVGALALIPAIVGTLSYRLIAIWSAPRKRALASRSAAAVAADSVFWRTFHGARYDEIQPALETLTQAYLATPRDATTAAHIGWLHIWRIAESARLDAAPATITEDMRLARRFFDEAVRLDPSDARKQGFLASALMGEGQIDDDQRLIRRGYFTMLDAIKAWPAFNLFTAGYVVSLAPAKSKQFAEGLAWEWRDLDVCAGERVDRVHPDFSKYMGRITDARACLNTWIAPHNGEGFFLNMGDMLVKSGDWRTAQQVYAYAKLLPEYPTWPYRELLAARLRDAEANVARFNGRDPDRKTGMMGRSVFACMACHQQ